MHSSSTRKPSEVRGRGCGQVLDPVVAAVSSLKDFTKLSPQSLNHYNKTSHAIWLFSTFGCWVFAPMVLHDLVVSELGLMIHYMVLYMALLW